MRAEHAYLTDDSDTDDMELRLSQGDNGDWYLSILPKGDRFTRHCVRITTSGQRRHDLPQAVHAMYNAMAPREVR